MGPSSFFSSTCNRENPVWSPEVLFNFTYHTSWVCASQCAKGVRSKTGESEGCKARASASRLPRRHVGIYPGVSLPLPSSWGLARQRPLGLSELCIEVTTLGRTLSFVRKTVGPRVESKSLHRLSPLQPLPQPPLFP